MSLYTVFGGRGFIGSEIVKQLNELGHNVFVPERGDESIYHKDLGTIIYCAGHGDCITLNHSNITKGFDIIFFLKPIGFIAVH